MTGAAEPRAATPAVEPEDLRNVVGTEQVVHRIFHPRAVAVVGASSREGSLSWMPLHLLRTKGFAGPIYPVNPNRDELHGVPCFASVEDLPDGVDVAVIVMNAQRSEQAARACADRGIGALVMPTQGMGERGPDGKQRERDMVAYARERGTRIVGPNTDGIANLANGAIASFQVLFGREIKVGPVAIVSQSGATAGSLFNRLQAQGIGGRFYASAGNEADLGLEDYLSYMVQHPEVGMVLAYVESIRRPDDFRAVAQVAAELGKPIGLIKVGRSEQGARRASAHTGALAGPDRLYDGLFAAHGIVRVDELSELVSLAKLYVQGGTPRTRGVGIYSVSGGQAGTAADAATSMGLHVPPLEAETAKLLDDILEFGDAFNPADLTGAVATDDTLAATFYDAFSRQPDIGTVIYVRKALPAGQDVGAAKNLARIERGDDRALLAVYAMDGELGAEEAAHFDGAGIPVFHSLHELFTAVRGLAGYNEHLPRAGTAPDGSGPRTGTPLPPDLDEEGAKRLLTSYGLCGPRSEVASDPDGAVEAAQRIGFPVVCKIVSPDIAHKTEVGGVELGLRGPDEVRAAAQRILERARRDAPDARVTGIAVQEQVVGGVEVLAGITVDDSLGPFVLVGLGGVFAEALEDVVLRPAPLTDEDARGMIAQLRGRRLLDGFRGAPPADVDALASALVGLSQLAIDHADTLQEVDLNPILVRPVGEGVRVLDALVVTRDDAPSD